MTGKRMACVLALGLALVGAGLPAAADLKVTVEISGSIEEILPILQMLQQSGLERAAAEEMQGLKLEIQSTVTQDEQTPEETAPAMPEAPPQPAFTGIATAPAVAKPGESVLITVQVNDPLKQVDTVAARTVEPGTYAFDLFDNGTQGDLVPNDGTWSYQYTVPADAPAGTIDFEVIAYNASAEPVQVTGETGEPAALTTRVTVGVQP